jgi:hypothetical protein
MLFGAGTSLLLLFVLELMGVRSRSEYVNDAVDCDDVLGSEERCPALPGTR